MKKIENATYYKCDYCGKISAKASAMMMHERFCINRPHNDCLCIRCGWAIVGKAAGYAEDYIFDGPHKYKVSALLSYCTKHKEFMCLRQSQHYAEGVTDGNCFIAKYADEGCSDFTNESKIPCAYELGYSMTDLVKAQDKNVDDAIRVLLEQMPAALYNDDLQSFFKQFQK